MDIIYGEERRITGSNLESFYLDYYLELQRYYPNSLSIFAMVLKVNECS